jgi:hypothetical protein
MKRFAAGFGVLLFLLSSRIAGAQAGAEDEARAQFDTGVELFEAGKFEQAAVSFARAYELKPSFRILYNIGQVENELGHFAKALDAYTRYLAEGGDQIEQARLDQVRVEVARLNKLVGMISVDGAPPGATVFVDERRSGTTPLPGPIFVDLGEHQVQVKHGKDELHSEIVTVAGGQQVAVKLEAGADPGAPPPGDGIADAVGPGTAEPTPAAKPKRVWTWIAFGVGGAAAIGGAITGGLTLSRAEELKSECGGDACPSTSADALDSARSLGNATDVLIAVAAVGIAAGVVLYFVEPRRGDREDGGVAIAPAAAPTAGGAALALAGRF